MKGLLFAALLGLVWLGINIPLAGSALASHKDERRTHAGSVHIHFGAWHYGAPRHHTRPRFRRGHRNHPPGHRRAYRHGRHDLYVFSAPRRVYRQGRREHWMVRPCRLTSKIGFDGYGRRARIGGTMCYDAYGTPYILQGSRYIIHYF